MKKLLLLLALIPSLVFAQVTPGNPVKITAPLGQKTKANSIPVTLPSDIGALSVQTTSGGEVTVNGTVLIADTFGNNIETDGAGNLKVISTGMPVLLNDGSSNPLSSTSGALDVSLRSSGTTLPVSGTFWQATQPVSLASVPSHAVTNAGTFAVQAAQSGTWNVGIAPQTSGGLSAFHLASAASTNATNIKASAGQLFGWYIKNNNTSVAKKVSFHNTAGTPTAGASVFISLDLPPGGAANALGEIGIPFSTGIAITTTVGGGGDSDSAAVSANDLNINIFYK